MRRKPIYIFGAVIILISSMIYGCVHFMRGEREKLLEEPAIVGVSTGYLLSWKSVEHADIYYVYVDDELVSEQTENTYILEDINPLEGYLLKVEAVDLDNDYESNESLMFFSPFAQTTLNDLVSVDDDIFYLGYEQTHNANLYGLAKFRFESIVSTGYIVSINVDDIVYEDPIIVKSNNENRLIPFNPLKQGHTMPLDAFSTSIFYLFTFEPGQKIDIKIEYLDLLDLSMNHEIIVGPNQTLQFPIIEPSDQYLLGIENASDDIKTTLFHTIYRQEDIESTDHLIFKSAVKTKMQMIKIENKSDITQTLLITPFMYEDVTHQESININESQDEKFILLTGFEPFGFIFNLDFQKLKTDFDVDIYIVNRLNGLIRIDQEIENIEHHLYRLRLPLETYQDVAILIVIKNQIVLDDSMEPSQFTGYIA